jgi:hypothetical protein
MGSPRQHRDLQEAIRAEFPAKARQCKEVWRLPQHNPPWNGIVSNDLTLILQLRVHDGGQVDIEGADIKDVQLHDPSLESCLLDAVQKMDPLSLPTTSSGPYGSLLSTPPLADGLYRYEYPVRILKNVVNQ